MGVNLRPIIVKNSIDMENLKNRIITIDASNIIHQFLSTIRQPNGTPLTDSEGNITSHLVGLFYRTLRLLKDFSIKPVYVFDGEMPDVKFDIVEKRKIRREKAAEKWIEMKKKKSNEEAFREAVKSAVISPQMIQDSKKLLSLLGLPTVQALGEAEAQCAYMTKNAKIFAMNSRDYDSLLFGAKILLRYLTISSKTNVEIIKLDEFLKHHKITHEQLVDIGILIGTDYNDGIFGVGPKTSLKLIKQYERIENIPTKYLDALDENFLEIRNLFLNPVVTDEYSLRFSEPDKSGLINFLCEEGGFPKERVVNNLEK